jgi:hypothetical protein
LKNGNFYSSSRKAKISTTEIYGIFRGLKFEPSAEIEEKVPFCKGLYETWHADHETFEKRPPFKKRTFFKGLDYSV